MRMRFQVDLVQLPELTRTALLTIHKGGILCKELSFEYRSIERYICEFIYLSRIRSALTGSRNCFDNVTFGYKNACSVLCHDSFFTNL